jgi:CubicO group peptidase (beta-lactamase class C family)
MICIRVLFSFCFLISGWGALFAQLSSEQTQKLDSLFLSWNAPNHPGGVAGIEIDGKTVYAQAFGLASLDYLVPNNTGTLFNIASVSKQFTSMAMLMLEREGKLTVRDDIRQHLPELPDFGHPITIEHCMQHTSGMRSLHALLALAGWRDDDSRTNEDLLRFMTRQKDLNFEPGAEYLYCNTGYILMALILERVTGEEFPAWMKKHIFEPMGMVHTYVEDNYARVVPGNATSYYNNGEQGFDRSIEYWGYVGSGNIHSNLHDMLTWQRNYYAPAEGWEDLFARMETQGVLNNGDTIPYAYGVNVSRYQGEKRIVHGGSIGGYRSSASTFPDQKMSVVLMSNFPTNVGGKANAMVDILLGKESAQAELLALPENTLDLSTRKLAQYEGLYWNDEQAYKRKVYVKDDTLRYFRSASSESKLLPLDKDLFQMIEVPDEFLLRFDLTNKRQKRITFIENGKESGGLIEFEEAEITPALLKKYVGSYYSKELDTWYELRLEENQLKGYHSRHGAFGLQVIKEDVLEADLWLFGTVRVKMGENGQAEGLWVSNGRVRNAWFERH